MNWHPHLTVAAVIEQDNTFLIVKERIDGEIVYNQPAGHLEPHETFIEAVIREVNEETARMFEPTGLVGLYRIYAKEKDITYLRACFSGNVVEHNSEQALDSDIIEAAWMSKEELLSSDIPLRSPMVIQCINDYLAGKHYPLDIIKDMGNV